MVWILQQSLVKCLFLPNSDKDRTMPKKLSIVLLGLTLVLMILPNLILGSELDYVEFLQFCDENFGAEGEPLAYDFHGSELVFMETGFWIHASVNSAAIGFETNLPSKSRVEYGQTAEYGLSSEMTEIHYYLHLNYLKGLQANTTYHYRLVSTDERGNTIYSSDRVFQTVTPNNTIYVPGNLGNPPFNLILDDATYVLTQDIVADTRAFTFNGQNITLDLNGFVVTYDNGPPFVPSGSTNGDFVTSDVSSFGVMGRYGISGRVINGTLQQGLSNSTGDNSVGFNPIFLGPNETNTMEIAGITAIYSGIDVGGIVGYGGITDIHHNVVIDKGTGILNRMQGIKAIVCKDNHPVTARYNLIKRSRHQGIVTPYSAINNEVYIDSWATNSYGIKPIPNSTISGNRVFGTGYHNVGIGWPAETDTDWLNILSNYIHLQGAAPTNRSSEYGLHSSVNGLRITQYGVGTVPFNNCLYQNNMVIVKGKDGCQTMRGTQFCSDPYISNLVFRDNIIKTEVMDDQTGIAPCVVAHGNSGLEGEWLPVLYEDNTFITNSVHVRFGDSYASAGNHQFKNCNLVRFGSSPDYLTIKIGYWNWNSNDNLFIDCTLGDDVSFDNNSFEGTEGGGNRDYSVGHSLHIVAQDIYSEPLANSTIEVHDNTGLTFAGTTDSQGFAKLELLEYTYAALAGETSSMKTARLEHFFQTESYQPFVLGSDIFGTRNEPENPILIIFNSSDDIQAPGVPRNPRIN